MADEHRTGDRSVLFALHFLGGSAREWGAVATLLDATMRVEPLDLPGFGDAAAATGYSVAEMAAFVTRAIAAEAPKRWLLAGHSMGAKVATAIARSVEDGDGPGGLAGVVTLAGSPPSPEPMDEARREKMLSWFGGDSESRRAQAREFIGANVVSLERQAYDRAVDDVLRMNRAAWIAWLTHGSREDWSERIGTLRTPALVLAGADDADLGPGAQRDLMLPHFTNVRAATLAGVKHLLPLEDPAEVARRIAEFAGV